MRALRLPIGLPRLGYDVCMKVFRLLNRQGFEFRKLLLETEVHHALCLVGATEHGGVPALVGGGRHVPQVGNAAALGPSAAAIKIRGLATPTQMRRVQLLASTYMIRS